ncbi:hypothetical protein [Streptomyces sp. WAC06614]|uniref:hypothetical protein n=1 Tax=Streptomyces sp. WAC06614 TaxID=2487416 RepID=UPI000F76FAE2|nr:hypothetical protein [Streptomyces sp. WAC06614]RSS73996.1 hypothetical protein EF918_25165 [Streptomyces sp. WAC06614]
MPQAVLSTLSPDWPCQVKAPGTHDWERTASRWLRDLLPARYAGYSTLTRNPALLARHAQLQLQHEMRAVRQALQTSRVELPTLGLAETVIETSIRMYAVELDQLNRLARGVRLIADALAAGAPVGAQRRR